MKSPLVIGAMGGSGTRVIARIVKHASYFMGTNLNTSEDAMDFVEFYDRWIDCFLRPENHTFDDTYINNHMEKEFADCVANHRAMIPNQDRSWGWKEPRSIYLLPFIHKLFPGMKFIHVIRDGRDMAFSPNQNQLKKHGEAVLDSKYESLSEPVKTAILWDKINLMAAEYGEVKMRGQYLRIRFEDLCHETGMTVKLIFDFLGVDKQANMNTALQEVQPPESIGRWRDSRDLELIFSIQGYAKEALVRFSYMQAGSV